MCIRDSNNTTGDYNSAFGINSLKVSVSGDNNTALGWNSLTANASGANNTAIGSEAGDVITTGGNNVIIGSSSDPSANSASNQIVIGYGATGQANNSVTLGNADVTAVYMAQDQGATVYAAGVDITGSTGLILENDETITNAVDGTVLVTAATTSVSGDLALADDKSVILGTNSDITVKYDETTNDALEIATNVDAAALELVLKTDRGDDAGDEWSVNVADGGVMTFGNDIASAGTYVTHLTVTPHATLSSSSVAIAGDATVGDDLTVTGNDITFGNAESISNATDGTLTLNGEVAAGTGGATGIFKSNGDYDATLKTGNTTTGSITITDGANGDITIAPNGTGETDFDGNPIANFSASTVSITSATTLAATHNGKVLICNNSSDFSLTVPEDTLPAGFNCMIVQIGAGEVTLTAASGNVNIRNRNSHTKTADQWAVMTLICIDATTDANVFVSGGDGTS